MNLLWNQNKKHGIVVAKFNTNLITIRCYAKSQTSFRLTKQIIFIFMFLARPHTAVTDPQF